MTKQTKTFRSWYDSLSLEGKKRFRDDFLLATGLSHPGLYTKLRRGNFTFLEQNFIVKHADQELNFEKAPILN